MFASLLSFEFVSFSVLSIAVFSAVRGMLRQGLFLLANLTFVYFILGPVGLLTTIGFCTLGYVLLLWQRANPSLSLMTTITLLILPFMYMLNYEFLGLLLPDDFLWTTLRTIGLSFILFKMIHVLVDSKGGSVEKVDYLTHLNYCLNFTTFMMGPIQRYQDYYAQWNGLKEAIPLTFEAHLDAVVRVLFGLVKIYVIGVVFARFAFQTGTDVTALSFPSLMVKLYAFYFYLYMNFSGYCDVMIGIGSLIGNRPPENFNKPFIAPNISDFWLRQHRSLTLWLTDYVFTPAYKWELSHKTLSRHPLLAGNLAICMTMLVSGLWHGTTLGFLFFGIAHGLFLTIYHSWDHFLVKRYGRKQVNRLRKTWVARGIGIFLTFNAASFAFLFFQIDTPNLVALIDQVLSR